MKKIDQRIKLLQKTALQALEDLKAQDIVALDIKKISNIADMIIICSGTSNRHVKALADNIVEHAKKAKFQVLGVEGETDCEWVLVDFGDIIVHIMQAKTREFYELEKLWGMI